MFYQQKKKFEQIKEVQNQRKISNNGSSWATHAASTAAAALRDFKIDASNTLSLGYKGHRESA